MTRDELVSRLGVAFIEGLLLLIIAISLIAFVVAVIDWRKR